MTELVRIRFDSDPTGLPPVDVVEADGHRTLKGYAVVYGAVSSADMAGRRFRFSKDSIKWQPEVLALWSHELAAPLGATSNQSLKMFEDAKGWGVEISLLDTTLHNDVYTMVKSRLVKGMSFGGYMNMRSLNEASDGVFDVKEFHGLEVTVTPAPRFTESSIAVKAEKSSEKKKGFAQDRRKLDQIRLRAYPVTRQRS